MIKIYLDDRKDEFNDCESMNLNHSSLLILLLHLTTNITITNLDEKISV